MITYVYVKNKPKSMKILHEKRENNQIKWI